MSVQQSMAVEGHHLTEEDVQRAAVAVLSAANHTPSQAAVELVELLGPDADVEFEFCESTFFSALSRIGQLAEGNALAEEIEASFVARLNDALCKGLVCWRVLRGEERGTISLDGVLVDFRTAALAVVDIETELRGVVEHHVDLSIPGQQFDNSSATGAPIP
ncbi:MAG: hypothetical protein JNK72_24775 [Myxococcales bacterium]|nr:hypothetical protein [Myxococcales bacterium]